MKCMPRTLSGRFVSAPMRVIEMHEVLTAKTARSRADGVDPRVDLALDLPLLGDVLDHEVDLGEVVEAVVKRMRPSTASAGSASPLWAGAPFWNMPWKRRFLRISSRARSSTSSEMSTRTT